MHYTWDFAVIAKYWRAFVNGLAVTYELTLWSLLFSTVIALLVCFLNISHNRPLRIVSTLYIEFFRTIPSLVTLVWVYYGLPIIVGFALSSKISVIIGLSVCQSAYSAEVFRAGIESIPRGQMEAARSAGMSYFMAMRRIILPQAFRLLIPTFMNEFTSLLKWTSLASVVGVAEVMQRSNFIIQTSYKPLEVYTMAALSYVMVILPVTQWARRYEKKRRIDTADA